MLTSANDGSNVVSGEGVVEIILDGSQCQARREEKCRSVSSNIRMNLSEYVGNKFRRDSTFGTLSSGRQKAGLIGNPDRSTSCEKEHESPFRQPCYEQ